MTPLFIALFYKEPSEEPYLWYKGTEVRVSSK